MSSLAGSLADTSLTLSYEATVLLLTAGPCYTLLHYTYHHAMLLLAYHLPHCLGFVVVLVVVVVVVVLAAVWWCALIRAVSPINSCNLLITTITLNNTDYVFPGILAAQAHLSVHYQLAVSTVTSFTITC